MVGESKKEWACRVNCAHASLSRNPDLRQYSVSVIDFIAMKEAEIAFFHTYEQALFGKSAIEIELDDWGDRWRTRVDDMIRWQKLSVAHIQPGDI